MGLLCPVDGTYQPIRENITADLSKTNAHAKNVIGYRLACGHDVYAEEVKELQKAIDRANAEFAVGNDKLKKEHNEKLAAAWRAIRSTKK